MDEPRTPPVAATPVPDPIQADNALTINGQEHPLVEGGYDARHDAQLPASESDVAALKAGHATLEQAEALAKADTATAADKPPARP